MNQAQAKMQRQPQRPLHHIFATPVKVEGQLKSILTDREASAKLVNHFLREAMDDGLLPKEVVIAQFVAVPPRKDSPYLDLRNYILLREATSHITEALRAYIFTVGALRLIKWSFHREVTWKCYGPAGSTIVFTLNQNAPSSSFFNLANLFWVNYQLDKAPKTPFLSELLLDPPLERAIELVPLLERAQNVSLIQSTKLPKASYSCIVHVKDGLHASDIKQVMDFHQNVLLPKWEYFSYCLPAVAKGSIVLAVPRPVHFTDPSQHEGVGDSGLAVAFEEGHVITSEDVERVYFVSQRVNSLFTSLYSLAQSTQHAKELAIREKFIGYGAHTVSGLIDDALNYLSWAKARDREANLSRAETRLKRIKRNSQAVLAALNPVIAREPVQVNIQSLISTFLDEVIEDRRLAADPRQAFLDFTLQLEALSIRTSLPDLLEVLLTSLIRNALEHIDKSIRDGWPIERCSLIIRSKQTKTGIEVEVENGGTPVDSSLVQTLNSDEEDDSTFKITRKGASHYGLGTKKCKWATKDLGGHLEYHVIDGRLVARACFLE